MGKGKKVTIGYKYYLGVHQILCHGPIDSIKRISADDKELWSGTATGGTITINKPTIFGGDEREGGVKGDVDVALGSNTQAVNSYLASKLGALTPAFRGVAALILKQVYIGNNSYPKAWVIRASRINTRTDGSTQWYSTKAAIGSDMNPAHMIVECLTNAEWGMGYNDSDIDLATFQTAADTMHSEGMGISLLWDKGATIEDFIQEVLNHIDGSLFVDRASGKFTLKLARGGYDVGTLLTLDESNIEEISDLKRSTQDELYNTITVTYWDLASGKDGSVTVSDTALVAQRGYTIGEKLEFPGFTNGTIANKIAMRELKGLSTPLLKCTIDANREAAVLNVADVFKLNWPRYGINNLVMRVASLDFGSSTNHTIRIECVEDVFALGTAVFSTPPASGWVSPSSAPAAMLYRSVIEAPYWELARRAGDTVAASTASTFGYVAATGTRPSGDALNADLMTNPTNTSYVYADKVDFCPTAVLSAAVNQTATTWAISSGEDLDDVVIGTYAIIDSEFVSIVAVSDTSLTVGRGVLDTVPAAHAINARILFVDDFYQVDGQEYASGEVARIKMLPVTGEGTLAIGSAPENTVTMNSRLGRPYPPGNVKVNGVAYPASVPAYGDLVFTWSHRDRLQQTATLIDTTAGSIGPEAGTTYTLKVYGDGGILRHTATGLSTTSTTYVQQADSVTSDVVLLLPMFGANSGTVFTDYSFAPKTVTRFNAVTSTAKSKWYGSSGKFDSTTDYLTIPDSSDFELSTDITIEAYVNPDSIAPYRTICSKRPDASVNEWSFYLEGASFKFAVWDNSAVLVGSVTGPATAVIGTWYHVAVTLQGTTLRLFVDGVLSATTTLTGTPGTSTQDLHVGRYPSNTSRDWFGYMQDLRITKGTARYTADFTPPMQLVPPGDTQLTVELESIRSGLTSLQKHSLVLPRV